MLSEGEITTELERRIVAYFREKGLITPNYVRERVYDEGVEPQGGEGRFSRGHVQQKVARFADHGHAENLYDTGLYEWVAELDGADR